MSREPSSDERYLEEHVRLDEAKMNLIKNPMRIVVFSPHPDDAELMAGGFLSSAVRRGARVKVVVVADDRIAFGGDQVSLTVREMPMEERVAIRKREENEAMRILGIKDVTFLEYIDSEVPEAKALLPEFITIMRDYEPDLAITVDPLLPYEAQSDHINVGRAVMEAVFFHAFPYVARRAKVKSKSPVLALGYTSSPNAIVSIDGTIDVKVKSFLAHVSQCPDAKKMEEWIRRTASVYGKAIDCSYGEAFKVLHVSELHVNVGFGGPAGIW